MASDYNSRPSAAEVLVEGERLRGDPAQPGDRAAVRGRAHPGLARAHGLTRAGERHEQRRPAADARLSAPGLAGAAGRHRRAALAGACGRRSRCSASFAALSLFGLWLVLPLPLHLVAAGGLRRRRSAVPCGGRARRCGLGLARCRPVAAGAGQRRRRTSRCARSTTALPGDFTDPATQRLWALHRAAADREPGAAAAEPAALGPAAPRPVGAAGGAAAGPGAGAWSMRAARSAPRLGSAFSFGGAPAQASLPPMVDLWVTPPAYTRRAPLVSEQTRGVQALAVPTGSEARAAGRTICRRASRPSSSTARPRRRSRRWAPAAARRRWPLDRDAFLSVRDASGPGDRQLARSTWCRTRCRPSASSASRAPPTAACCKIDLEAADDYGVAELALLLAPPGARARPSG